MKKLIVYVILISFAQEGGYAQSTNMIPNSSFEFYYPGLNPDIDTGFMDNEGVLCWARATAMVPYYRIFSYATVSPYPWPLGHLPHSGNAYIELSLKASLSGNILDSSFDYKSYAETKLTEPLSAGVNYTFGMHVANILDSTSLTNYLITCSDNIDIYFSSSKISNYNTLGLLNANPQIQFNLNFFTDSSSWVYLTGSYTASGGEQYLTIGNFKPYLLSDYISLAIPVNNGSFDIHSFLFIDDISLYPDTATSFINPSILNLGNDTIICNNQIINDTLIAQPGFFHYLWNTGDTGESIIINGPGIYWCSVDFGCNWFTDTIIITMDSSIHVQLPDDTALCNTDFPFTVAETNEQANYYWNTGDTTSSISINTPGTYWVKTITPCSEHVDSIHVSLVNIPLLDLGGDTSFCADQLLNFVVEAPPGFTTYQWSNGSDNQEITITEPGNYSLTASYTCGVIRDTIIIALDSIPTVNLGEDVLLCKGEQITLDATQNFSVQYYWNTGGSTSQLNVSEAGLYSVSVENNCGIAVDTIIVDGIDCNHCVFVPNAFTPNGDGINDVFKLIIQCPEISGFRMVVFNRWGESIFEAVDPDIGWDGTTLDKPQAMDTYIYMVQYVIGEINKSKIEKGSVMLIR